jgi:phage host-nuclease inhibitor protein Gam
MAKKKDPKPLVQEQPEPKETAPQLPSNLAEASVALELIGHLFREAIALSAETDEKIAEIRAATDKAIRPLQEKAGQCFKDLQAFAEANRAELTESGKQKTVRLATGTMSWRDDPPSVRVEDKEAAIKDAQRRRLQRFLRPKVELDKKAMLAEPQVAQRITGVTIVREEKFSVKPENSALDLNAEIIAKLLKAQTK